MWYIGGPCWLSILNRAVCHVHSKLPNYPFPLSFPLATISSFSKSVSLCFVSNELPDNKLWKILKEMGTPEHLTCLLRNLCAGQEAIVRTGHGTTGKGVCQVGKGVRQGCILSPCLFNFYAWYISKMLGWMKISWNQDFWEKYQ